MLLDLRRKRLGEVRATPQSADDLWILSQVIEPGDMVRGRTDRKEKIGGDEARSGRAVRVPMVLTLEVEKADWAGDVLRILGLIREGPQDAPRGAHHTLATEAGADLTIIKTAWPAYQLARLQEAAAAGARTVLLLLFDREEALLAWLVPSGTQILARLRGAVPKKDQSGQGHGDFFRDLGDALAAAAAQRHPDLIIAASPAFWSAPFRAALPAPVRDRVLLTVCSDVSAAAIPEILRRPEVLQAMAASQLAREPAWLDELLEGIAKGRACWGIQDCAHRAAQGAVKTLFVSTLHITKLREAGQFAPLEELMRGVERAGGAVHSISTSPICARLDGLGGVAGLLRWT